MGLGARGGLRLENARALDPAVGSAFGRGPGCRRSLADAGAVSTCESVMGQYRDLPFVPDARVGPTAHVVGRALEALFLEQVLGAGR